jgi:tetratricopeptide (TPR) repeat protein
MTTKKLTRPNGAALGRDPLQIVLLISTLLAVILACCFGAWAAADGEPRPAGREALEWAFRFASAIDPDPKDKARAQESVIRDAAAAGRLDMALDWVERVDGWRQAVLFADLAAECAKTGRKEDARGLVGRAEAVRAGIRGWQNPRISAHVAQALANLGEIEQSRRIAADLVAQDGQQYLGRAVATIATGLAVNGDIEGARDELAKLADSHDLYETWWRTAAYISLAREDGLPAKQRSSFLIEARRSADGIDGWKRAEALASIAEELIRLGEVKQARKTLREADSLILPLSDEISVKALLLTSLARPWALAGDEAHSRELLVRAEPLVPNALNVEQPAVWATVASGYVTLGDRREASRLYGEALTAAGALVNARPRALAVVAVCRSMGREELAVDAATGETLRELFDGLGDPW